MDSSIASLLVFVLVKGGFFFIKARVKLFFVKYKPVYNFIKRAKLTWFVFKLNIPSFPVYLGLLCL